MQCIIIEISLDNPVQKFISNILLFLISFVFVFKTSCYIFQKKIAMHLGIFGGVISKIRKKREIQIYCNCNNDVGISFYYCYTLKKRNCNRNTKQINMTLQLQHWNIKTAKTLWNCNKREIKINCNCNNDVGISFYYCHTLKKRNCNWNAKQINMVLQLQHWNIKINKIPWNCNCNIWKSLNHMKINSTVTLSYNCNTATTAAELLTAAAT